MSSKRKIIEKLALAIASTKTDIADSKEHIEEQTKELKRLEEELKTVQSLERSVGADKAPMNLTYLHSDKIYRSRRSFDVYPFVYDFRMELYGTMVANISIVIRNRYLKECQFSNLRITGINPELSPEGVFKTAVMDYFNTCKQAKNTKEQIDEVLKDLEIFICRNEDPEFDYMPHDEVTLGNMKYVFKSRRVMPLPGEERYGTEGLLEITNTKNGAVSTASEPVESFEEFIRKYLTGITFEIEDEFDFIKSEASRILVRHNMDIVKRDGGINGSNIYKVVRRK